MSLPSFFIPLLFPDKCVFCGKVIKSGHICSDCTSDLPYTEGARAARKGEFFTECVSPFYYKGVVRNTVLNLKFGGHQSYVSAYAKYCARTVRDRLDGKFDMITWVPVSEKRLRSRGFDQAEILAEALAKELNMPCIRTLVKQRDAVPQSTLSDDARRKANVSGAYTAVGGDFINKRVLLVDDLITTGATMNECARTLLMAGAEEIYCCTFARAK